MPEAQPGDADRPVPTPPTGSSSDPDAGPLPSTPYEPAEPNAPPPGYAEDETRKPADQAGETSGGPRVIALMNQKGGVGKTTTAVNLGAALASDAGGGHRVLMIDLDPQAHLTLSMGVDPEELEVSMYHLLTDPSVTATQTVMEVHDDAIPEGRLGILPAEVNLAGVESELADKVATGMAQTVLRNKIRDLLAHFDYVIMDCPPSLGLLTINALVVAKEVIVPMQAHFLALQGLSKLLETVQMVRQGINDGLVVSGVVLCMHEGQTLLAGEVMSDLAGFFDEAKGQGLPWSEGTVYQPAVRRNIKLAESPSFGQSIFTYAPDSNGAADYRALARSVAAHRAAGA